MSNLLHKNKKKKNSIEKVPLTKPKNTFNRNDIFTIDENINLNKSNNIKKTTTIRCDKEIADEINSLTATMNFNSVNDFLGYTLYKIKAELNTEQKKEFEVIKKVYSKKRKK